MRTEIKDRGYRI